jgi:hypothetical protein
MYMILCVIDQPDKLDNVLQTWKEIGIAGVTMLESTGLHRLSIQPHIPMRYAYRGSEAERGNITLLAVVQNEEIIQHCLAVTEAAVGDFSKPNTGIFIAWPLAFAKGVIGKQP